MNWTLSDYANLAQVITIPVAFLCWYFTKDQFAKFWKRYFIPVLTVLIQWPLICEREIKERFEIEPKESEVLQRDFVINDDFAQILVYSHIKNVSKPGKIGWITSTVVDFDAEEQKQTHTIMSNEKTSPGKRQGEAKPKPQPTQQPIRRTQEQGVPNKTTSLPKKTG